MAIPDFQTVMLSLLQRLADGMEHLNRDVPEALADQQNQDAPETGIWIQ